MLRKYSEGLFPRGCPKCGRHFATLWDYVRVTEQLSPVVSYDADLNDYEPLDPIGIFVMANCLCGTTMALSTERMPRSSKSIKYWDGSGAETKRTSLNPTALLNGVRNEIRRQLLVERRMTNNERIGTQEPPSARHSNRCGAAPCAGIPTSTRLV